MSFYVWLQSILDSSTVTYLGETHPANEIYSVVDMDHLDVLDAFHAYVTKQTDFHVKALGTTWRPEH